MLRFTIFLTLLIIGGIAAGQSGKTLVNRLSGPDDIVWSSLGDNENASMPVGNGDLAANVWTEKNGDIILLLAKTDAWAETGSLLKLGRIRVKITPNSFGDTLQFKQVLRLQTGTIGLICGGNSIRIWADANAPVIHLEASLAGPGKLTATVEPWRKARPAAGVSRNAPDAAVMNGEKDPWLKPDVTFPVYKNRLSWCHYNADSYYPYIMRQEHLESLTGRFPDPLYQRSFGALLMGPGLVKQDERSLSSDRAQRSLQLDIIALTDTASPSPDAWFRKIDQLGDRLSLQNIKSRRLAHEKWWARFWNRSWIRVSGSEEAAQVSQGYAIQRYMIASSSRGAFPVKFNGGLFTVGHDVGEGKQDKDKHDPDYRAWGEAYWNQNNRLMYWPLVATGDTDLLQPWFGMYLKVLAFQKARNSLYYHHAGASYPETMLFYGLPRLSDFGKDNPTNEIASHWQRYHVQGTLELIAQMLDQYDYYGDRAFVRQSLVPFADAIITYYDQHWPRGSNGKIRMDPMQSLETYQLDAVNPAPDIAGLMSVIPRLLALPHDLTGEQQRNTWSKVLKDLPPLPRGKTLKGKTPPLGEGEPGGTTILLPAEKYGKPGNSENPELYAVFPYRLFGMGKPDLDLARNTFAARRSPQNTCWGQDGTQASVLGLTAEAQKAVVNEFTNYGDQRFQWFWKPAHDWIPDLDNGGSGMITLQHMLMQCDGKKIQLIPAWPLNWNAEFKLHAPYQTTVEAKVEGGKLTSLKVTPASRRKDAIIAKPAN